MDIGKQLARSHDIGIKVANVNNKRTHTAVEHYTARVREAVGEQGSGKLPGIMAAANPASCMQYAIDAFQRSILFLDALRQRGDGFVKNTAAGLKPVLHFDYETVLDGRNFERPVNYALLRITPPEGVTIDNAKRPYLIIDPRAGHGPGIGGFKDDSQVGVALAAGHPVYFVIFFRDPEPGQTMLDVCTAEQVFLKKVRDLHPSSAKPALIGNCQGGWAAMMIATADPDLAGPIVINGAPMSYWSGAWSEGEGDNPMRYAGGILGGTWLSSLTADMGNGKFDGAHLVQNFESLNPANSMWDKYYNLYSNIDTETPRFLEFERWWGGYYLMNREEIEWITSNLFVGNKLWGGDVKGSTGKSFDLRSIKSPIVLFASMGDNITPPQQAFNWVADTYGSTEEIKARGQVIVGLLHQEVGHLGIFVSGKVAKKEHNQIVSVLDQIELLPPGLYGMHIVDRKEKGAKGEVEYDVDFKEFRLEDIAARFNRFERIDEQPFEALAEVSKFNQRAYELFAQPMVEATSNEFSARLLRQFHPLRMQNWSMSHLNPWLAWLEPMAKSVAAQRRPVAEDHPLRRAEEIGSEMISASLDLYRGMRDAATESAFFTIYGNMFAFYLAEKHEKEVSAIHPVSDPRELPYVIDALDSISQGGYNEAFARVAFLITRKGETLPLSLLLMREELAATYASYVPDLPRDQWRRIRGEQEIIARYEPERALGTLPALLSDPADRERLLTLLDKVIADPRVQASRPTPEQLAMFDRIHLVLSEAPPLAAKPAIVASDRLH
jgi:pimeloyl-ACP methyl ester carboxylesterase